MSLFRLVLLEMLHRKGNFLLSVVSVVVSVAVAVALVVVLGVYEFQTSESLKEKEAATQAVNEAKEKRTAEDMAVMQDDYRKIGKVLGFNLLILPKAQDMTAYHTTGQVTATMPEEYVERLATCGLMTIRHLLPTIERTIEWPERDDRTFILSGVKGEVPQGQGGPVREPIMQPVRPGTIVLGYELWNEAGLEVGQDVTMHDRKFKVAACNPERGTRDDITAWIDLPVAQEILGAEGEISAIQALKCHCAGAEIEQVKADVAAQLPETRVIAPVSKIETRALARDRAKETAVSTIQSEAEHHERIKEEEHAHHQAVLGRLASFSAWFLPLLIVGAAVWIGLLALMNVQRRASEIGILRAIGFRDSQVYGLVLSRLLVIGLVGGLLGFFAGGFAATYFCDAEAADALEQTLFNPILMTVALVGAPLLSLIAGLPPAVVAASRDPAEVLGSEV